MNNDPLDPRERWLAILFFSGLSVAVLALWAAKLVGY